MLLPRSATAQEAEPNVYSDFLAKGPLESSDAELREWVQEIEAKEKPKREEEEEPNSATAYGAEMLLSATFLHFREDGRLQITSWEIMKVVDRDAATEASQLVEDWAPWRSSTPKISARVLTSDGKTIKHDGRSAFEQSASDGRNAILTDRKRLTLLLNGVDEGAVIESKRTHVLSPILGDAIARRVALADVMPFRVVLLRVTADPGVLPEITAMGGDPRPVIANEKDKDFNVVYVLEDPPSLFDTFEALSGAERTTYPLVLVARPASWESLGSTYFQSVEKSIASGATVVKRIVEAAPAAIKNGSNAEKLAWCREKIRQLVRYTGVEFGEHSVLPVSPDQAIGRRFGDCKDQSTLLVSMLAELDVDAHVALLAVGTALDVTDDVPTLDYFNHAIAYVDDLDQWVDLTSEFYLEDTLPPALRSRKALICREEGGELARIPTDTADKHVEKQIDIYRVNFSGIGEEQVDLYCTGDSAVSVQFPYEQSPPQRLVASWQQFFLNAIGTQQVESLRVGEVAGGFGVSARSGRAQIFDREAFTIKATWDSREILGEFPVSIRPYADQQKGMLVDALERKSPMHFVLGSTGIGGVDIQYPAALDVGGLPKAFTKTFGPISLSATFEKLNTRGEKGQLQQKTLREMVVTPNAPKFPAQLYDATIRIRYTITINPGIATAKEVNACAKYVRTLYEDDGPLTGKIDLTWESLTRHGKSPTNETLDAFRLEAIKYRAFEEPYIGLLYELGIHGLGDFARKESSEFTELDEIPTLKNSWLIPVKCASDLVLNRLVPKVNKTELREMLESAPTTLETSSYHLQATLMEESGLHTLDQDRIRKSFDQIDTFLSDPQFANLALVQQGGFYGHVLFAGLATHQEERALETLELRSPELFALLNSIIKNKPTLDFAVGLSDSQKEFQQRLMWESAVAAERFGLALRIQEMCATDGLPLKLTLEDASKQEFSSDEDSAEFAAQSALSALLKYELDAAKELYREPDGVDIAVKPPFFGPILADSWFVRSRALRTSTLVDTVVALTPTEVEEICGSACYVRFLYPYKSRFGGGELEHEFTMAKEPGSGEWKVLAFTMEVDDFCKKLVDNGLLEDATKLLDEISRPPTADEGVMGFLSSLARPDTRTPQQRLWSKLKDVEAETRVRIASLAFDIADEDDLAEFEEALAKSGIKWTVSQTAVLNELREQVWSKIGDYEKIYELLVDRCERSGNLEPLEELLATVYRDRLVGGELYKNAEVKSFVDAAQAKPNSELIWRLPVDYKFAIGEESEAFELLFERLKEKPGEPQTANMCLWRALLADVPLEKLEEYVDRVSEVRPFESESEANYIHSIVCAQARLGRTYDALKNLRDVNDSASIKLASRKLAHGLLLESLGFKEAAREAFELVVREDYEMHLNAIAKLALKRLSQ